MQLKDHLLELFFFNDATNKVLFDKVEQLNNQGECIRLISHLINCQYKWLARMVDFENADKLDWWHPRYGPDQFDTEWTRSLQPWIEYVENRSDDELLVEREFIGFDGGRWAAAPKDVALQLNFHSIHHRAQIQTIIREQGVEPDFVDFIGTKYRKLN